MQKGGLSGHIRQQTNICLQVTGHQKCPPRFKFNDVKNPSLCLAKRMCNRVRICKAELSTAAISVPSSYKRLVASRVGSDFKQVATLVTLPMDKLEDNEVLIKVEVAGINGGCETFRVRGEGSFTSNIGQELFPVGAEGGGTVMALGAGVRGLQAGQQVAFNGGAAFSEYSVVRSSMVTPLDTRDVAEGVTLSLAGMTAMVALEYAGKVGAGQVVLITAAAGGVGHLAVQLAKLLGARVVAVVGGPNKAAALRSLPAQPDIIIDRSKQDVGAELSTSFPEGVDVIIDGVGGSLRQLLATHLKPGGTLVQVGYISEYPHNFPAENHAEAAEADTGDFGRSTCSVSPSSISISSSSTTESVEASSSMRSGQSPMHEAGMTTEKTHSQSQLPPAAELFWSEKTVEVDGRTFTGKIWPRDAKTLIRCRRRLFDLYRQQKLKVLVDESHGLKGIESVPAAVEYMLQGQHVGKVILRL